MPDGDVTITVTLDTKEIKAKIAELTKDLEQMAKSANGDGLDQELRGIVSTLEDVTKRVEEVSRAMNGMSPNSTGYQSAQKELEGYANTLAVADARARSATNNVTRYSKKTNSALASIKKSASQAFSFKGISVGIRRLAQLAFGVYSVTALINKLKSAIKQGINNLVQFESDTNATNQAMTELKTSLLFIQNAWGAAFAPIINVVQPILTALMDTFAELGNTIARFFGALTGQSQVLQAVRVSTQDYASSLKSAGGAAKQLQDRLAGFDDLNVLGKDNGGGGGGGVSGPDPSEMFEYVDVSKEEFAGIFDWLDKINQKIEESGLKKAIEDFWEALNKFKESELGKALQKVLDVILERSFDTTLAVLTDILNLLTAIMNGDLEGAVNSLKDLFVDVSFGPIEALAGAIDTLCGTDFSGWLAEVKKELKDFKIEDLPAWERFRDVLDDIGESFDRLKQSLSRLSPIWDKLNKNGMLDKLTKLFVKFEEAKIDLLISNIATALDGLVDTLNVIIDLIELGSSTFDAFREIFRAFYTGDWTTAVTAIADVLKGFVRFLVDLGKLLINVLEQPVLAVVSAFDTMLGTNYAEAIAESFSDTFDTIEQACDDAIDNLFNVTDALDKNKTAWDKVGDATDSTKSRWADAGNMGEDVSASLDKTAESGESLGATFADSSLVVGLASDNMVNSAQTLSDTVTQSCTELSDNVTTETDTMVKKSYEKIETFKTDTTTAFADTKTEVTHEMQYAKTEVVSEAMQMQAESGKVWGGMVTDADESFNQLSDNTVGTFDGLAGALENPINNIIDMIEGMVNRVIDGINAFTGGLSEITGLDIAGSLGLPSSFNTIPHVTLPHLAQGAVIPPNREFMAVLGDQSSGTNIEAPLDTIKQAVADVMGSGNAEVVALLQQLITVVESKNLSIGDKEIGQANARYTQRQNRVRGVGF